MKNLILCGGVGSRLWPLSRTLLPKQFAQLIGDSSLFEQTVRRNRNLVTATLVAANQHQSFLAAAQLQGLGQNDVEGLIEPVGRNTAPAIALVCLTLAPDELVLVTPSDHVIRDQAAYEAAVRQAMELAQAGHLVTFGIKPEYPETGFGYIEADGNKVLSFKEKPDLATAKRYVDSGRFWWNSGMFCFHAGTFLSELQQYAPELYQASLAAYEASRASQPLQPTRALMEAIPSISIDFAVMEKSTKVAVVPCSIGWSDLGSLDAIYDFEPKQPSGNAVRTTVEPVMVNSQSNLVVSERQVALIDIEDCLIIDSPDALLVAKRGSSQQVKQVYEKLKQTNPVLTDTFPRVERPWGWHCQVAGGDGFQVRQVLIRPGCQTSRHRHRERDEQWTVLAGEARIEIDGVSTKAGLGAGASAKKGSPHRLINGGTTDVIVLEIQTGINLTASDLERLPDAYLAKPSARSG